MPTCLFTGFTPFLHHSSNPSEDLALYFAGKTVHGHKIESAVIPVDFLRAWPVMQESLQNKHYDLILLNGLAEARGQISLEKYAFNSISSKHPDNSGLQKEGEISPGSSPQLISTFTESSLVHLACELRLKGHDVGVSEDPGRYLCNFLYYTTLLHLSAQRLGTKCVFIHWPLHGQNAEPAALGMPDNIHFIEDFLASLSS